MDYRERYEINLELLLQRIHQGNELKREKNAAVQAIHELNREVDVLRHEQRIAQNTIENYERVVREMSILLEQHRNQTFVFHGCVEELKNRYPRLFSNATTTKTTN